MACEYLETCPFFHDKLENMPVTAETYKKQYCRADFITCARYRIAKEKGPENVPDDLFPNQRSKADRILEQE
jgi:hypothetical protein